MKFLFFSRVFLFVLISIGNNVVAASLAPLQYLQLTNPGANEGYQYTIATTSSRTFTKLVVTPYNGSACSNDTIIPTVTMQASQDTTLIASHTYASTSDSSWALVHLNISCLRRSNQFLYLQKNHIMDGKHQKLKIIKT